MTETSGHSKRCCTVDSFPIHWKAMCISLTLVYLCAIGHACVSERAFNRACFQCMEIHDAPVLNKWPPCLCGFLPGVADAWIMWRRVLGGHVGSIVLGSSLNVAPNLHRVNERFTSSAQRLRCGGEECARPTPCRQNQVLSVWLGTPSSISPVHFPLPRIKSAHDNTSALMTCRQDRQFSMPTFCHVCPVCGRRSDKVFVTLMQLVEPFNANKKNTLW